MGHVATEGSLLGREGKWRACGWAVVQLDYVEEDAELEVQRTIKRAELTALFCVFIQSDWTHQGACGQQRKY